MLFYQRINILAISSRLHYSMVFQSCNTVHRIVWIFSLSLFFRRFTAFSGLFQYILPLLIISIIYLTIFRYIKVEITITLGQNGFTWTVSFYCSNKLCSSLNSKQITQSFAKLLLSFQNLNSIDFLLHKSHSVSFWAMNMFFK